MMWRMVALGAAGQALVEQDALASEGASWPAQPSMQLACLTRPGWMQAWYLTPCAPAGGDLHTKLTRSLVPYTEKEAAGIMRAVLGVLQHCHDMGVAYRCSGCRGNGGC